MKVSFRKLRHAQSQIRNRAERTLLTRLDQRFSRRLLQPFYVAQPKTQREFFSIMLKGAIPVRAGYIHRLHAQAVDVTCSDWNCTLEHDGEKLSLRLGLRYVKGLQQAAGEALVQARKESPFSSISDLALRVPQLSKTRSEER